MQQLGDVRHVSTPYIRQLGASPACKKHRWMPLVAQPQATAQSFASIQRTMDHWQCHSRTQTARRCSSSIQGGFSQPRVMKCSRTFRHLSFCTHAMQIVQAEPASPRRSTATAGTADASATSYSHLTSTQNPDPATVTVNLTVDYSHPALYTNDEAFETASYWDARYVSAPVGTPTGTFEWYRDYNSLRPLLLQHLPQTAPLLHVGVGSSVIQADMVEDGWQSITNLDFSKVVIDQLSALHAHLAPHLQYVVGDVRKLLTADNTFGSVLDKGTMCAVLCGEGSGPEDAAAMLREVHRVLQPGGVYMQITYAKPADRLPLLLQPNTPWSHGLVYEVGQHKQILGPFLVFGEGHEDMHRDATPSQSCSRVDLLSSMTAGEGKVPQNAFVEEGLHEQPDPKTVQHAPGYAMGRSSGLHAPVLHPELLGLPRLGYSHFVYVLSRS